MTMNNVMNEKEFYDYVEKELGKYLPKSLRKGTINLADVRKTNDVMLKSLNIMQEGEDIVPNLYLNDFFKEYKEGAKLEDVLGNIQ